MRHRLTFGPILFIATLFGCAGTPEDGRDPGGAITRSPTRFSSAKGPLRIALAGLVHGHAEGLLSSARRREDLEIVGVYEPNAELFQRLASRHGLDADLGYLDLEAMLDATRPEAVSVMTSVADHVAVVEACAPRGIHMLVEKPLAFARADAEFIGELSAQHGVLVLTNYETSWYTSVREAQRRVQSGEFQPLRKMIFRHGHGGPIEIGCYGEFTDWLTTPEGNGGGALVDFGCYGAVLATWMMGGRAPTRVTASAQTLKPAMYPRTDDDATILLEYPEASAILQASWAWTHDVKEMDLYTDAGSLHAGRRDKLTIRRPDQEPEVVVPAEAPGHLADEWTYLREVIRGQCEVDPLSSFAFNATVAGILDDARSEVARAVEAATRRRRLPAPPRRPRDLQLGRRRR